MLATVEGFLFTNSIRRFLAVVLFLQMIESLIIAYYLWQEKKRGTYRAIALLIISRSFGTIYLIYLIGDYSPITPVKFLFVPLTIAEVLTNICGLFVIRLVRSEERVRR